MNEWIPMSITAAVDRVHASTQAGLAFLATVGSTSPFVGLFGTVWGIYHALTAIGISGQASIDKVAGPVGEALIMTAIGLRSPFPPCSPTTGWLAATRPDGRSARVRGRTQRRHRRLRRPRRLSAVAP